MPPSAKRLASTLWTDIKPSGSRQLKALFGRKVFENPKPVDLVQRLIRFAGGNRKDILVLDSFAGSGTTASAVLDLNSRDGGHRRYIVLQMTEGTEAQPGRNVCRDITRERIVRATEKYAYKAGFQYVRVGQPMELPSGGPSAA